jgi:replicative DNA helicase
MTNGLQPGALIVLAARPGMGKTSLAMNLVENAALRAGKTCAVFSLEMPRTEIVQRLICAYANVSMKNALSGELTQKEWKKLYLAGDQLKKSNIYIDDSSRITPSEILSKCRRLKSTAGGVDLIMIDYIQLMSSGDSKTAGSDNRTQEVASITRDLKIMAKELGVPVIALSQLRRIQSKEPTLSDLRESGAIEQDADIVMFINRPEAVATAEELASGSVTKGAAELILAKHRAGEQGRVSLKFIGEYTKFVDVDEQNRDEEPPEYSHAAIDYEDDEEYVAPDDEYIPPEPPARKGDLKPMEDMEIPFE